jgi:phosphatidate phosphatase PAH1
MTRTPGTFRSSQFLSLLLLPVAACGGSNAAPQSDAGTTPLDAWTAPLDAPAASLDAPAANDAPALDAGFDANIPCVPQTIPAVVSDIDETLTTDDAEIFMQIFVDGTYDPMMRAGAEMLMQGYRDRCYHIVYLTGRGEDTRLQGTNEPMLDATRRWLTEHQFPLDEEGTRVRLQQIASIDSAVLRAYKANALQGYQCADGFRFDYAYGNSVSDIQAYDDARLSKATTFIIGDHAGEMATQAITDPDYLAHIASFLETVPSVCPVDVDAGVPDTDAFVDPDAGTPESDAGEPDASFVP